MEIAPLLKRLREGDRDAAPQLMAVLYPELRQAAARAMRRERPGHTLQPTALVNEAFLRLSSDSTACWEDRAQFLGIAARLMRQILVDHARKRHAAKRGFGNRITMADGLVIAEERLEEVIAWDEILNRLDKLDPRQGRIVELRFFGGLGVEEIAEVMGISQPTVKREWASARAWLHRQITKSRGAASGA
jgi:RNA polymerase sigma factor (TIGR02999 family)